MRTAVFLAIGIVLLVVAGAVLAPAASLDRPLATASRQRIRLTEATGFWWHGHGILTTKAGEARLPIGWQLAIAPLLSGTIVVGLEAGSDDAMPSGTLALRHGTVEARDLRLRAPAAFVSAFVPALKAVALGGEVLLRAPAFTWSDRAVTGTLDARWQDARVVAGGSTLDMGAVSVLAAPKDGGLAGTIGNEGGDLAIAGAFADRAGSVIASLDLKPRPGASDVVRAMLPLLGASDGAGGVQVKWRSDR